ncbi:MAG: phosphoribosyltransferase family protein [Bacteroidota bacterium]|jgi:pyrimidine operon attenuation protein/uracil phosphoribosyltransferase
MQVSRKYILSKEQVERKIRRLAFEIAERNFNKQELYFVAIKDNGVTLAVKIANILSAISTVQVHICALSLDKKNPKDIIVDPLPSPKDAVIILIDDVASSGKTMLYALQPLLKIYPAKIQTLVLVERTHKAFPIQIDYVGMSVATTLEEHIYVEVEGSELTGAYMD